MENRAKIKEIFESIQGEGLFIGKKQLFVRFCNCNLKCNYCDTPHNPDLVENGTTFNFTPNELFDYIDKNYDMNSISSISLTGGEPLLWVDFLKEFMPKVKNKFYLETNATLVEKIEQVLPYIQIIAGDIKIPSCSGVKNSFEMHDKFFSVLKNYRIDCAVTRHYDCDDKLIFAKIIFDENITDDEIEKCVMLGRKYNLELILQPKMIGNNLSVDTQFMINLLDKFTKKYNKVRLIPQVHKFLGIE